MINWWSFREFQLGLRVDNVTCLNDDLLPVHPPVFRRAEHPVFLVYMLPRVKIKDILLKK